jgi:hypothetical protein
MAVTQNAIHDMRESGVSYAICGATFWITHEMPGWAADDRDYWWRVLKFGRVAVTITKTSRRLLQIDVEGVSPDGRSAPIAVACPPPALAPNGRPGVLIALEWQPRVVSLSVQDRLVAEHRFVLH